MELHQRSVSREQMQKFAGYMAEIFEAFGLDLNTPGTEETPQRFVEALFEATEGYDGDPKLLKVFDTECRGEPDCRLSQVIEGPIPFYALCEHHVLPFFGNAKRFAVQERMGEQIVNTLDTMLQPHGVAVYLEAHHLCVAMRGVRETSPLTRTTFWRGEYDKNASLRSEFLQARYSKEWVGWKGANGDEIGTSLRILSSGQS